MSTLSKYGLFIHRKQANLGAKRFIEYSLYEELAEALISSVATFKKIRDHQLVHQAVHQAVHQLPHQAFPISSKFLNQTTTKTGQEGSDNLEAILKRPEMRYWTTHPNILTARQLATWMDEFGLNAETLAMYLDYCRFDMIENGKEKKVETNPINYFYGTVRNTGHYKIPENYLTLEQLRTREAEEVLKRKQEANRKLEETLRLSKLEDLRAEFLVIYNNPESEEYKNLLGGSKTGQFVENQEIIKADMWAAFQKEHGFEPKEAKNND